MPLSQKTIILTILLAIMAIFLYSVRSILTPFVLGAVFAYILNPAVVFLEKRTKLAKGIAVLVVFFTVVILIGAISTEIGIRLAKETRDFSLESKYHNTLTNIRLENLPPWLSPSIKETIDSVNPAKIFRPDNVWPYFSGALSGIGSLFIFLITGFYFLKEGSKFVEKATSFLPNVDRVDVAILIRKINSALNNYLRGQVYLIVLMSFVSWLVLSFLGVRYAVMIGIFTGFAEIIPIIGPIVAGTVAVTVALLDGVPMFGATPFFEGLIVASAYFILRELEDIFVIPFILGRATKLHPLIVLFAVLAGGHLWGILGMIFAVPIAAIVRVSAEFLLARLPDGQEKIA
ncbi:AI-2E family transporter [Candidatus Microgenomates bacterium]|nr:AI-2E family transporter [Candidatus Microgenomates bacterium]